MKLTLLASAMVLLASVPVSAQQIQGEGRGRLAACRADMATHCANVEAGRGRRMGCLQENAAKLSPECASALTARIEGGKGERSGLGGSGAPAQNDQAQAPGPGTAGKDRIDTSPKGPSPVGRAGRGEGRMAACRTDAAAFCRSAEQGGGRMRCLRENQAKLSPACQAAILQRQSQANNLRAACKSDRESLCGNVQRGGGAIMGCLRDNQAKLSAGCSSALSALPERGARSKAKRT